MKTKLSAITIGRLHAAIEPLLADKTISVTVRKRYLLEALDDCRTITFEFYLLPSAKKLSVASFSLGANLRMLGTYDDIRVNWSAWGAQEMEIVREFATVLTKAANVATTLQAILEGRHEKQP